MVEDFRLYAAVLLTLPCLILSAALLRTRRARRPRLPPSPFAIPVIGHLHLLSAIPHQSLHKLSLRHGPFFSLRLGSFPCVVASSASYARDFLKTHELSFSGRPVSTAVRRLTYSAADFTFASYGPYWRFIKKLCTSLLLGGRTLDLHLSVRRDEQSRLLRSLHDSARKKEAVDIRGELVKLTNNIICQMTMSRRCSDGGQADEVRAIVEETEELMGKFNLADYIPYLNNWDPQGLGKRNEDVHRRFDDMMEAILREKMAAEGGGGGDILDMLLEISKDETAEVRLTRDNIKAFILDTFAAGTDTSAITTEWALAELIRHPDVMRRARDEIGTVVGNSRLVGEADIGELPYLAAVVKETLRLHPTGPLIARVSASDCMVGEYEIPAGTTLFVNVWAIGRDPESWPEPLEFRPERFLGSGVDVRGQHYELLPFGSGRRGCPGTALAMAVVGTAVAGMIQCFEWEVNGGVVDMVEGPGMTLPRAHPLVCTPVARLNPMPLD